MAPSTAAGSDAADNGANAGAAAKAAAPSARRRRWLAAAGALLIALLAAFLLWPSEENPGPPPPEGVGPTAPVAEQRRRPPPAPAPQQLAREVPGGPGAAPIIDEITVEKPEVCEGEENLITVKAHTPDGSDAFLHYLVGATPGPQVPLRTWLPDDGEDPKLEVKVFGKNNVVTSVPLPRFLVKSCRPKHIISLIPHLKSNTFGDYVFEAKIVQPQPLDMDARPAPPFQAASYEWTFGDGQAATTTQPWAEHSYESRPQGQMYSHFLVQVTARAADGETVTGRASLQLLNPTYEDFASKGVVTLMVQLTPRFPELGSDGVVRQRVRLYHFRDKPVYIHSAVKFAHRQANPTAPVRPAPEDPFALMGGNIIPPGHGIEFEARLDTSREPDVFSMEHYLEGKDSDSHPVRGAFSIMRPPPKPTKENSDAVLDPQLKQKILAARRILNTPYVTDEDLWRLEREGKFADLPPLPQPPPSLERPKTPAPEPEPPPGLGPTGTGSGDRLDGHDRKR